MNHFGKSIQSPHMTNSTDIDEDSPFSRKLSFAKKEAYPQYEKRRIQDITDLLKESDSENENFEHKEENDPNIIEEESDPNNCQMINDNIHPILNCQIPNFYFNNEISSNLENGIDDESTFSNFYFSNEHSKTFSEQKRELSHYCNDSLDEEEEDSEKDPNIISEIELENIFMNSNEVSDMFDSVYIQQSEKSFEDW